MKSIVYILLFVAALSPRGGFADVRKAKGYEPKQAYGTVLEQKFINLAGRQGIWRGVVQGHGRIKLKLQIFEGQRLISSASMGETTLLNGKRTFFVYKATVPKARDWTWKVVAQATSLVT